MRERDGVREREEVRVSFFLRSVSHALKVVPLGEVFWENVFLDLFLAALLLVLILPASPGLLCAAGAPFCLFFSVSLRVCVFLTLEC